MAKIEIENCQTVLSNKEQIVIRAQKLDGENRELSLKLEVERENHRKKQLDKQTKMQEEQERIKQEMTRRRLEYKEKTKNAIIFTGPKRRRKQEATFKLLKQRKSKNNANNSKAK